MTLKKLTAMPYAQAHIEIDDDHNKTLFSYVTRVAELTSDGWLTVYGLHSMTTRKHIGAFMREYTNLDYYTAKAAYEGNYRINVETGEIEESAQANSACPGAENFSTFFHKALDKSAKIWYNKVSNQGGCTYDLQNHYC